VGKQPIIPLTITKYNKLLKERSSKVKINLRVLYEQTNTHQKQESQTQNIFLYINDK
jgi:hypothetical protein